MTRMTAKPIEVAIVGGGCAAMAAALELTRPELAGRHHVTVYQLGWRLGGKGASGRGDGGRIEEHGLHVWMGWYENAFRLLRECYVELGREAQWADAFVPDSYSGVAEQAGDGLWRTWMSAIPPAPGQPGDPRNAASSLNIVDYVRRGSTLLFTLVGSLDREQADSRFTRTNQSPAGVAERVLQLVQQGLLYSTAGLCEAARLFETMSGALPLYPANLITALLEPLGQAARARFEGQLDAKPDDRYRWEIVDLLIAALCGIFRHGLLTHRDGFDAIDDYELRDWLRMNGAAQKSVDGAFLRGLYALPFSNGNGGQAGPGIAAGQGLRGAFRTFFTYRGDIFWKLRGGMGDVVFAPIYEVLQRRGVNFRFFHRLEQVRIAAGRDGQQSYVRALEFDVQAELTDAGEYRPLAVVNGKSCWPALPDYAQLRDGATLAAIGVDFESHWDTRSVARRSLEVGADFDFVVLAVGLGAIPHVCGDLIASNPRWQLMIDNVRTTPTQALQLWLNEDMETLGRTHPPTNIVGFTPPFDSWGDMRQLIAEEGGEAPAAAIAYFCGPLADLEPEPPRSDTGYPARRAAEVRANALTYLEQSLHHLWPGARSAAGGFRWELLERPRATSAAGDTQAATEAALDTQYWRANVNPTDRYTLSVPGSAKFRISPLDASYDNLTVAGDWTACGFNAGCVEAAVMSGRLAAHAIAQTPALEDIVGYDHP